MNKIAEAAALFYENGQRDPEPLLKILGQALAGGEDLYVLPGEKQAAGGGRFWLPARTEKEEVLSSLSFQELVRMVLTEDSFLGILLDPDGHPLYLSLDILEDLLERAGLAGGSSHPSLSERARTLLEEGDLYRSDPAGFSCERSLDAYRKAFSLAEKEKDDYVYPEICLRLCEFHPGLYEKEDLLSLFDEAIARFRRRVSAGDREAPARLVYALRLKEMAQARGNGRMRPPKNIPGSFFEF